MKLSGRERFFEEIGRYIVFAGMLLQSALGMVCVICWLYHTDGIEIFGALGGVGIYALLAYAFLKHRYPQQKRRRHLCGALFIVSTPAVLQAGLSVLSGNIIWAVVCGLFVVWYAFFKRLRRRSMRYMLTALCLVLLLLCSSLGEPAPSFAVRMTSRFCYPNMNRIVYNMPQELKDAVGYIQFRDALYTADGLDEAWYSGVVEKCRSRAEADRLCLRLAKYGLENNTRQDCLDIFWDYMGYHFPVPVAEMRMQGLSGASGDGVAYGRLLEKTGYAGHIYWSYSVVFYVCSLLIAVCAAGRHRQRPQEVDIVLGALLEAVICWLVLQGGGLFVYDKLPMTSFISGSLLMADDSASWHKGADVQGGDK